MNDNEYQIGQRVWFADGRGLDNLNSGVVIHKFVHYNQTLYVIELSTPIEPTWVVREWATLTDKRNGRLNWLKNFGKFAREYGR